MQSPPSRLASLDVLRAVAVLLVLGRHVAPTPIDQGLVLHRVTGLWNQGGWVGVDLFFVLSGFLISGLLFREWRNFGEISPSRFYIRRGLKIYPAFFVFLAATGVAMSFLGERPSVRQILGEVLFLQNYVGRVWLHTWSLAVEEHFYLILPLLLLLLSKRNGNDGCIDPFRPLPMLVAILAVEILALRLLNAGLAGGNKGLFPTHLRIDSLAIGVACSYLFHFRRPLLDCWIGRHSRFVTVLGAAMLLPAFVVPLTVPFTYTVGFTISAVGSSLLLLAFVLGEFPSGRVVAGLACLGNYSYSIYLWHLPVQQWGMPLLANYFRALQSPGIAATIVYVATSILIGVIMAKLVEYPVLHIRDRFFPSRSGELETRPTTASPIKGTVGGTQLVRPATTGCQSRSGRAAVVGAGFLLLPILTFLAARLVEARIRSPIAIALEQYRQTLIGFDLGCDSVSPQHKEWTRYDAARVEIYPAKGAWPRVLGHVDTNPNTFEVAWTEPQHPPVAGPNAFMVPLDRGLVADSDCVTLLFLKGVAPNGMVMAKTCASLVCIGPMKGQLVFDSYATAVLKGDVSGKITSESSIDLVVTGKFSGCIVANSYGMMYLMGGCDGSVELKHGAKVYIAGRMTSADLIRVKGQGNVFVENSDLSPGDHKLGGLTVTVGNERQAGIKASTKSVFTSRLPSSSTSSCGGYRTLATRKPVPSFRVLGFAPPRLADPVLFRLRIARTDATDCQSAPSLQFGTRSMRFHGIQYACSLPSGSWHYLPETQ